MSKRGLSVSMSIERASCVVLSSAPIDCPICGRHVPANTKHECDTDGGVGTVRHTPVEPDQLLAEGLSAAFGLPRRKRK